MNRPVLFYLLDYCPPGNAGRFRVNSITCNACKCLSFRGIPAFWLLPAACWFRVNSYLSIGKFLPIFAFLPLWFSAFRLSQRGGFVLIAKRDRGAGNLNLIARNILHWRNLPCLFSNPNMKIYLIYLTTNDNLPSTVVGVGKLVMCYAACISLYLVGNPHWDQWNIPKTKLKLLHLF